MRRGTLITIIVLFLTLAVVAVVQINLGSRNDLPGPTTPSATP
jgi:hypothetical protein